MGWETIHGVRERRGDEDDGRGKESRAPPHPCLCFIHALARYDAVNMEDITGCRWREDNRCSARTM